jgi:hypothetical protein
MSGVFPESPCKPHDRSSAVASTGVIASFIVGSIVATIVLVLVTAPGGQGRFSVVPAKVVSVSIPVPISVSVRVIARVWLPRVVTIWRVLAGTGEVTPVATQAFCKVVILTPIKKSKK